nr:immunoglobulin light chain junction region [Macaca mulatta]MOY14656.1 immunoglobulin light chain junction region [Macaca mulatta]MOY14903.1 immunoglobulin light chain junction region [Macaca mulatta]MOY15448.1 immunoglobulin light chain junction region [Macaca mulatta]MOY17156.1 immunoglobulin light chain junction region [Macaca mulatta]
DYYCYSADSNGNYIF